VNPDLLVYRLAAARPILSLMNATQLTTNEATPPAKSPTTWNVDPLHTTVGFGIRHLMVTTVRGIFETVTGTVRFAADAPEWGEVDIAIDAASASTHDGRRDEHLRNGKFFDVAAHPMIAFRSTSIRPGTNGTYAVTGGLTLRGVTGSVTLAVGELTRPQRDFRGVTYNIALEAGGIALADEVSITIDLSLVEEAAR
jgi:polyisoprenoid-binding protein YceI